MYITFSGLILGGPRMGEHLGIQQVRVDLDNHVALEEPRSLWSGSTGAFPEAPHLYSHDGRWYLMIAEGGTERGHGISIARGDGPHGPFEKAPHNPLVSARSTVRPVQNTGHGDLVVGPDGDWLCVLLGVRPRSMTRAFSALGRESFVTPVRWRDDGWPEIDPVELNPRPGTSVRVDFAEPLDGEWIAVRALPEAVAEQRDGRLVLRGTGATLDDPRPAFIGRRQEHLTNETSATVDASAGVGGLAVRYDEHFHVELEVSADAVTARAVAAGLVQEWRHPLAEPVVRLHIASRPPEATGLLRTSDVFHLSATIDGDIVELARIDGRLLSSETAESFTGRVIGAYAVSGEVAVSDWTIDGDDA